MPASAVAVVKQIMPVDILVGEARLRGVHRRERATAGTLSGLAGNVFIADCPDPASWLPELARLRSAGTLGQVVVALKAEVWA